MPGCIDDILLIACIGGGGAYEAARQQDRSRRARLKLVNRLAIDNRLSIRIGGNVAFTGNTSSQLPPGADSNAVAALREVEEYVSAYRPPALSLPDPTGCAPRLQLGPWRVGGSASGGDAQKDEAEPLLFDELKRWLLLAASGAASVEDVAARLEFYRQLLMVPEVLSEAAFRRTVAGVCRHLDALLERRCGALRTCASQMGLLQEAGRDLLNALLPVLLFAVTDVFDAQRFCHITAERLRASAARSLGAAAAAGQAAAAGAPDGLARLWEADAGRLLRGLLLSEHCREFCAGGAAGAVALPLGQTFPDVQVELFHDWMDRADQGRSLQRSGLHVRFQRDTDMQQRYIDLCKGVDSYIKFLSLVGHFKRLANIDGDAGMYSVRDALHHLLQEIETVAMTIAQSAANIMEDVKKQVTDLVISRGSDDHARWIERLTMIDELEQRVSLQRLLTLVQELRHRSSEARLPSLRSSARRNLEQILSDSASEGFRARCAEEPPALAGGGLDCLRAGAPAVQDGAPAPAWSVEWHFRFQASEVPMELQESLGRAAEPPEAAGSAGAAGPEASSARLGNTVEKLNSGAIQDPGQPFYIFRDGEGDSYVALHRFGGREQAVDALGINRLPEPRSGAPREEGEREARLLEGGAEPEGEPRGEEPGEEEPGEGPRGGSRPAGAAPAPAAPGAAAAPGPGGRPPEGAAEGGREETEAEEPLPELAQVSSEEELAYYSILLHNPGLHEASGRISGAAALEVLRRSERRPPVPDRDLRGILADEGFSAERGGVDVDGLMRLGRRLARAQGAAEGGAPGVAFLPRLRGLRWDARRKRVNVLEPFDVPGAAP